MAKYFIKIYKVPNMSIVDTLVVDWYPFEIT